MARRRYLVAYDIADPKRLRQVCSIMESFGQRLQYSVFLCDLSQGELITLEKRVIEVMRLAEDSVIEIDLGPLGACPVVRSIGRSRTLPHHGPLVV